MRRSIAFLQFAAVALSAVVLASVPLVGVSAEETEAPKKRLHTIPEDGFSNQPEIQLTPKIERILNARSDEDLVICVGGCPEHRDIVVYAQPSNKAHKTNVVPKAPSEDDDAWSTPEKPVKSSDASSSESAVPAKAESDEAPESDMSNAEEAAGEGRLQPTASSDDTETAPPM